MTLVTKRTSSSLSNGSAKASPKDSSSQWTSMISLWLPRLLARPLPKVGLPRLAADGDAAKMPSTVLPMIMRRCSSEKSARPPTTCTVRGRLVRGKSRCRSSAAGSIAIDDVLDCLLSCSLDHPWQHYSVRNIRPLLLDLAVAISVIMEEPRIVHFFFLVFALFLFLFLFFN